MTFEQIEKLIDMGFTPDQITQLTISSVNPTPTEESTGPEGDASAVHPLSDSPSDPPTETTPTTPEVQEDTNTEVLAAIADLKKAVQANNIKTMSDKTVLFVTHRNTSLKICDNIIHIS